MKCPNCEKEGVKYIVKRIQKEKGKSPPKRIDFRCKCKYCDWVGET